MSRRSAQIAVHILSRGVLQVSLFMSFHVYILYSETIDEYYVGHSGKLENRVFRHVHSGSKATKKARDWVLVYKEQFDTKAEAYRREIEIKKRKSRKYIESLIRINTGPWLERPAGMREGRRFDSDILHYPLA
jgi:putative endonuclease